ncbi:cysteine proteinase [Annulohypoxylon truncatum]|uniref:cysteine proteinase n=1 Tax=Annulohypoxylon truncatum TaxID=327061 RepID=UPI002008DF8D|nr:cysteine proteinase [Annulohypoxylon truncatum]KAI1204284.1 cysteine proteinase [Annulohypoxylon truncatum]
MSVESSETSSEAGYLNQDAEGRTVMAELPVTIPPIPKKPKQQTPQQAIDDFWAKFTTKAPGKATTIIPRNEYAEKAARRSTKAVGTNTQTSYDEAAAVCKAKVAKIVKECRRVNQKYRDPHFDLESDLKWGSRDTLESLCNVEEKSSSDFRPKSVKRVVDIFDDPKFYIEGPTANDVRQGRDGDCWLLAALCTLSNKPSLIERVCVARDEQVGVYGFVFHRDGEWISEIIDDKLFLTKPDFDESFLERMLWEDRERINSEEQYRKAYQSGSGALYFAQCEHENETWLPLLEKAYAKAHGDYAAIEGGYTGEGIEDLTGGVTSELYASDILDKEYFWKEELMKVNEEFLFGCSTGMWGRGWGDRKGIVELHAYSIMKAVDIDGQRLVLLKNPWGKGEWKGAWADGSKEWTAEWLLKLNHRFGDDGNFWISYDDLLRKYQAFDRTRLFGPEWKVTSLWTTLSVPWASDYHETYFDFTLAKAGPVVIVLSQLDDRYYRGLEGQYRFELNFRLHKNGQEDYVVRSISPYCQNRSVNVELELEEGEYIVLLKTNATRYMDKMPIEEVVRNNARDRRDKLVAVGMSYDLAHSKGKVIETPEEKKARKEAEKRKKDKERQALKKKIMDARNRQHYLRVKDHNKRQEKKAKTKAKAQVKKAAKEAAKAEKSRAAAEEANNSKEQKSGPEKEKHVQVLSPSQSPEPDSKGPGSESSADPKIETPSTEPEKTSTDALLNTEEHPAEIPKEPESDETSGSIKIEEKVEPAEDTAELKNEGSKTDEGDKSQEKEASQEDEESSDESDVSSVSEISDRELDIELEHPAAPPVRPPQPPPEAPEEEADEFERKPWNAVATIGLRVYYKVSDEDKDKDIVKLRVVRPNPYAKDKKEKNDGESDEGDGEDDKQDETEGKQEEPKSSKGLDVDDSSKDATLEGDNEQRKKSILSLTPLVK